MDTGSFLQEILIPGLIGVLAAVIVGVEVGLYDGLDLETVSSLSLTVIATGLLVVAYLVGISLRHFGWRVAPRLVPSSATLYRAQLEEHWCEQVVTLKAKWLTPPTEQVSGTTANLSDDEAYQLVTRMAYYYLGHLNDSWASRLAYHRHIARVAGNSLSSLAILCIAFVVALGVRAAAQDFYGATVYLAGLLLALLLTYALRFSFAYRMGMYVDALIMTEITNQELGEA